MKALPFEALYTYGAVEPLTGEHFFLLFSNLDSDCFQLFLDEFAAAYPESLNVVQLDNGAFHKAKKLEIPENVVLLFQPAYSPDINPIERVWQYLKKQESWLNFEALADLQRNICQQLNALCRETVASLTGYPFISICKVKTPAFRRVAKYRTKFSKSRGNPGIFR